MLAMEKVYGQIGNKKRKNMRQLLLFLYNEIQGLPFVVVLNFWYETNPLTYSAVEQKNKT